MRDVPSQEGTAPGRELYVLHSTGILPALRVNPLTSGQIQQKLARLSRESKPQMLH